MSLVLFTLGEAAPAAAGQQSPFGMFGMMALVFGVMYFVMIRPQKRREKERKAMIEAAKSGDRIMLNSGFLGEIVTVKEKTLIVRIAEGTKVEVIKGAVAQVLEKDETPDSLEPAR